MKVMAPTPLVGAFMVANLIVVGFTIYKSHGSTFENWTLAFAGMVALIVTVIYCVDVPIPRWTRLIACFAALGVITVLVPEPVANLVGQALRRAKLGGNLLVTMDYAEARGVNKSELKAARTRVDAALGRKADPQSQDPSEVSLGGQRAFECVAPAEGYLLLDAPEHLYVRTSPDLCDAADAGGRSGKTALFVQVIDKSRLRQYRLYRGVGS